MVLRDRSREQTLNLISGLECEWQKIPWASQRGKNLAWDKRLKPAFIQLQCCSKDETIWDLYIHCLNCPHKALNATGIWFLEDIRKTDTKCRMKSLQEASGWSTRLLSSFGIESGSLQDSHNLIWSFPSVRMQCETGFQALSSGANPPVNIDSGFWRAAEKMTSQWTLLLSLPVCSSVTRGVRRRRNKRKKPK